MHKVDKYKTDLINVIPPNIQHILVIERYFRKRSLEYLSKSFSIPIMDLRFFFYTEDSLSIYNELKEKLGEFPEPSSLEEYKEFVIEKSKELLEKSTPLEFATLVRDVTPQLVLLEESSRKKRNIESQSNDSNSDAISAEYTVLEEHENYSPFIQLEFRTPKVLEEEELLKIPPANGPEN